MRSHALPLVLAGTIACTPTPPHPPPLPSSAGSEASAADAIVVVVADARDPWTNGDAGAAPRLFCADGEKAATTPDQASRSRHAASASEAFETNVRCWTSDPSRDWWCCKEISTAGDYDPVPDPFLCDPRFPRVVRMSEGGAPPDKASFAARVTSGDEAAKKKLRCYAPGPHRAFNSANWCCKPK
jgi:hypothetical protein